MTMKYYYSTELNHHGILGQKWGVRRFQNEDGSYTAEGKRRRRSDLGSTVLKTRSQYKNAKKDYKEAKSRATGIGKAVRSLTEKGRTENAKRAEALKRASSNLSKSESDYKQAKKYYLNSDEFREKAEKFAKIAAATAAVGLTAYAISKNKEKTVEILKNVGDKSAKALSASAERVGNAMIDAALMSVGGIAISKLAEKLPTDDSVDESTRNKNKVILDTATAGIKAATNANGSSNKSNSNEGNVGKDVSDKLGAPSKKGLDRQSSEYQGLFKDNSGNQRPSDVRAVIKSLASAGYDIDQLKAYVRGIDDGSIKHSLLDVGYFAVFSILEDHRI